MRRHDVQGERFDAFEPSPPPMVGPDGSLHHSPMPGVTERAPRICEQGPCRHYHTFFVQMDAQTPIAASVTDDGRLVGDAGLVAAKLEPHYYCYPTTGVEFVLGELPVVNCNRWVPVDPAALTSDQMYRDRFMASPAGREYETALDRWMQRQTALSNSEQQAIDEAAAEIAAAEAERAASDDPQPDDKEIP